MDDFFVPDINTFNLFKNAEYFEINALDSFMTVCEELENCLIDFSLIERQKISEYKKRMKQCEENNERLRDLNDQVIVAKINYRSFKKEDIDAYKGVIMSEPNSKESEEE